MAPRAPSITSPARRVGLRESDEAEHDGARHPRLGGAVAAHPFRELGHLDALQLHHLALLGRRRLMARLAGVELGVDQPARLEMGARQVDVLDHLLVGIAVDREEQRAGEDVGLLVALLGPHRDGEEELHPRHAIGIERAGVDVEGALAAGLDDLPVEVDTLRRLPALVLDELLEVDRPPDLAVEVAQLERQ